MSLTDDLSDEFLTDLATMCDRLGCDRSQMIGLMESESNIEASAHNPHGATGVIQFDNWDGHGLLSMPDGRHLTWEAVAAMSDDDQLHEVEAFFNTYRGHLSRPGQLYTVCFIPVQAISPHFGPSFVVCGIRPGDPFPQFQRANPGFDTAKKGYTTGQDMANAITRALSRPRAQEALSRLAALASATSMAPGSGV